MIKSVWTYREGRKSVMPFRQWELESEANPMDVFAVTICSLTVLQSLFFLSYFFVALVSYYLMYTGKGVCEPGDT